MFREKANPGTVDLSASRSSSSRRGRKRGRPFAPRQKQEVGEEEGMRSTKRRHEDGTASEEGKMSELFDVSREMEVEDSLRVLREGSTPDAREKGKEHEAATMLSMKDLVHAHDLEGGEEPIQHEQNHDGDKIDDEDDGKGKKGSLSMLLCAVDQVRSY